MDERRRRPLLRRLRREHRLDVARERARVPEDVELLDELPAGLADAAHVAARRRLRAGHDRRDGETGSGLDGLLAHVGALPRHEALAIPLRDDGRAPPLRVLRAPDPTRLAPHLYALLQRHRE